MAKYVAARNVCACGKVEFNDLAALSAAITRKPFECITCVNKRIRAAAKARKAKARAKGSVKGRSA